MSEGPANRRQFTLLALFVVVTEACLGLAAMRLVSRDERVSLLIVMAILGTGYAMAVLVGIVYRRLFRQSSD